MGRGEAEVRAVEVTGAGATDDVGRMEFLLTLRRRGIMDQAVLRAMDEVPRGVFVDAGFADSAYADRALPIACGQTISQPFVVAYMTERLAVAPQHRVLEIGTGSGYQAAVLSRLVRQVVSVERFRTLAEQARVRLKSLGYDNVEVVVGDGHAGVAAHAVGIERRYTSIAVIAIYVGLVVANFIWLLPILNGDPITPARLIAETWLPSWG